MEFAMLEYVNLDLALPKEEYKKRLRPLQQRLYELEHAVFDAKIPVVIIFEGWAATGKGRLISLLAERLDPRGFRVVPITPPRTAELRYPWMWRFWLKIPARGQMVAFDTSWYRRVLIDRLNKTIKKDELRSAYQDIAEFEEMLAADGTVILKFWLHISETDQKKRIKKLRKDKLTAWQVGEEDIQQNKRYEKYASFVEDMIARTDSPHAPWTIVESTDRYHMRVKVFETIITSLEAHLGQPSSLKAKAKPRRTTKEMKGAVNA
jgi:polyphosphate kinase 2 (PPK2 family)